MLSCCMRKTAYIVLKNLFLSSEIGPGYFEKKNIGIIWTSIENKQQNLSWNI